MHAATPAPTDTRERLIAAAVKVLARDGLSGATTRAIAQEAGLNEVTLFRHFQTKDRLLAAVVGENFGAKATASQLTVPPATDDLRADLLALARSYDTLLTANLPLVRTMLGEMHHHLTESHERQVFRAVFLPLKEAVRRRVEAAQQAGLIRPDRRADVLSELLLGAVFTGVLRRSLPHVRVDYSATLYLETAVATLLDGAGTGKDRA